MIVVVGVPTATSPWIESSMCRRTKWHRRLRVTELVAGSYRTDRIGTTYGGDRREGPGRVN